MRLLNAHYAGETMPTPVRRSDLEIADVLNANDGCVRAAARQLGYCESNVRRRADKSAIVSRALWEARMMSAAGRLADVKETHHAAPP